MTLDNLEVAVYHPVPPPPQTFVHLSSLCRSVPRRCIIAVLGFFEDLFTHRTVLIKIRQSGTQSTCEEWIIANLRRRQLDKKVQGKQACSEPVASASTVTKMTLNHYQKEHVCIDGLGYSSTEGRENKKWRSLLDGSMSHERLSGKTVVLKLR